MVSRQARELHQAAALGRFVGDYVTAVGITDVLLRLAALMPHLDRLCRYDASAQAAREVRDPQVAAVCDCYRRQFDD